MNPNRKRTSRRQYERARLKLAKIYKAQAEVKPPFYDYFDEYKAVLCDEFIKYALFKGGRGSLKSFSAVCFLIEESFNPAHRDTLFLFGREVQTSIADSVYALTKSLIQQAFLAEHFIFKQTRIINKLTGVEFAFIGLRATGGETQFSQVNKIKGKFNVRYIFVDEAQDLTDDTINVLFPTVNRGSNVAVIKKAWHPDNTGINDSNSRFIFAMNPNFDTDPIVMKIQKYIDEATNKGTRPNAVILHRNIFDVPEKFQDKQLLEQAEAEKNEIYFGHVWLGEASHKISGYCWAAIEQVHIRNRIKVYCMFLDPSFKGGDYTAVSFLGEHQGKLCVWGEAHKQSWNKCFNRLCELHKRYAPAYAYYEDNSLGTVPQDMFAERGINIRGHTTLGNKENRIYKVAAFTAHRCALVLNLCNTEYTQQVIKYNEEAPHDDAPDSLASVIIKSGFISDKMKF